MDYSVRCRLCFDTYNPACMALHLIIDLFPVRPPRKSGIAKSHSYVRINGMPTVRGIARPLRLRPTNCAVVVQVSDPRRTRYIWAVYRSCKSNKVHLGRAIRALYLSPSQRAKQVSKRAGGKNAPPSVCLSLYIYETVGTRAACVRRVTCDFGLGEARRGRGRGARLAGRRRIDVRPARPHVLRRGLVPVRPAEQVRMIIPDSSIP